MTSVDEVAALLDEVVVPLPPVRMAAVDAVGRVLAEAPLAAHPLPLFDQSAMDGYAVAHHDIADAPVTLPVSTEVAARGHDRMPQLPAGTAARVFTGGVLPAGADTIVRQELTTDLGDGLVRIDGSVDRGTDVRRRGEELGAGAALCEPGTELHAGLAGALVVAGVPDVLVSSSPRIRVVVTGDEVVTAGTTLSLGQVPDSNGPLLVATLRRWGLDDVGASRVGDDPALLAAAIDGAAGAAELVVTTGGVSVGDYDLVPPIAEELGFTRVLWKVAQRPGGPLFVAQRGGTLLVGLPGNPAAVFVNLHVHLRRILDRFVGLDPEQRWQWGVCTSRPPSAPGKVMWARCSVTTDRNGVVRLTPLPRQGSHMLSNLAAADALVRVDPELDLDRPGLVLAWIPVVH